MPLFGIFSKKKKEDKKDSTSKEAREAEQRKAEERRRKEEQKILEAQSTNYKPPNLFDGMQLNSVPNPKPPPPNPGVENLKNQKSETMSFGFLVSNNVPEEPVQEEKSISGSDIFQGLNTIVPDLKVSPYSMKDARASEEAANSSINTDIQLESKMNTSVGGNPSPFNLMDLLSDEPFNTEPSQPSQPTISKQSSLSSEVHRREISQEFEKPADVISQTGSVESSSTAQRNSLQGLSRKGDGVTYKWSMDLIKQKKEQQEMEARQEQALKHINQAKQQQMQIPAQLRVSITKEDIQAPKPVKFEPKQVSQTIIPKEPSSVEQFRETRNRGKFVPPAPTVIPAAQFLPKKQQIEFQVIQAQFQFGKVNSLEEMNKGLKSYKEELIRVTIEQHQITQRLDDWKKKIENKQETLKLAVEKENQLVSQELFQEGEKVKEMVDALKNELETMNYAQKSLEKDYNQKEIQKTGIVDKIIKNLEKSRDHFESKLDYSRGRLLNWEANEKKKLISKQLQGQSKVQELDTIEQRLSETKQQLESEQSRLHEKIKENTKDIVRRKQEVEEELQTVDSQIEQLKKQMEKLEGIRSGLEENIKECQHLIEEEQGKFGEDVAVINSLKKTLIKDEDRVNVLYEEIAVIQEQTEQLESKIAKYKEESQQNIAIWSRNLEGVTGLIERYEGQNTERLKIVHSISSLAEKLKFLENSENEYSVSMNNSKSMVSDLEIEIQQLKKEMESLGQKLQSAEINKKKMAAARQFNKAAIHVKEIKQFKEQTGEIEKELQIKEKELKEQNSRIEELSMKLPALTHQIEEMQVELKKRKKAFLEIRLKELEEMKDILSNENQTPDFKKLSVIREEKQSTEQELMRIKAVLQITEQQKEEIKEEEPQVQAIEQPSLVTEEQIIKDHKSGEIEKKEEIQKEEDKIQDPEQRIEELKQMINEHETRINEASEAEDFEEAARLDDEKVEMIEELRKLGVVLQDGGQIDDSKDQDLQLEDESPQSSLIEKNEEVVKPQDQQQQVGQNAMKEIEEVEQKVEVREEVKLNDRTDQESNQNRDNQDSKSEQEVALNQIRSEVDEEVQNDEKQSHQDEPRDQQAQQEEDQDQLEVKIGISKSQQQEQHDSQSTIITEIKYQNKETAKEQEEVKKEQQIKKNEELDIEKAVEVKVETQIERDEVTQAEVEIEAKEEVSSGGFSLGGGGGLFSGMAFK